jgi:hypothetical protein
MKSTLLYRKTVEREPRSTWRIKSAPSVDREGVVASTAIVTVAPAHWNYCCADAGKEEMAVKINMTAIRCMERSQVINEWMLAADRVQGRAALSKKGVTASG